jgi:hypothetical protein
MMSWSKSTPRFRGSLTLWTIIGPACVKKAIKSTQFKDYETSWLQFLTYYSVRVEILYCSNFRLHFFLKVKCWIIPHLRMGVIPWTEEGILSNFGIDLYKSVNRQLTKSPVLIGNVESIGKILSRLNWTLRDARLYIEKHWRKHESKPVSKRSSYPFCYRGGSTTPSIQGLPLWKIYNLGRISKQSHKTSTRLSKNTWELKHIMSL